LTEPRGAPNMATVPTAKRVTIILESGVRVSGLVLRPRGAEAWLVLAHGAGAGMTHPSMELLAVELAARKIATLRYQFPFMENNSKRPDGPDLCRATVRAAAAVARRLAGNLPLFAGGRSFGGRMTSQAQAAAPLMGVSGLVFFGFPLHTAGSESLQRGAHLSSITIPMLFLQGTRDALAQLPLLKPLLQRIGAHAALHVLDGADHSFHVLVRSGRTDADVRAEMVDAFVAWMAPLRAA
jgi:predicted alpha/beta-hydrolase family hydrolase